jgi:hypothetical protein
MQLKNTLFIAIGAGILLLIPLLSQWPWTTSDFIVAGLLLFGIGTAVDLIWRYAGKYRLWGAALAIFLFLWLWVELAVGLFTNWGS